MNEMSNGMIRYPLEVPPESGQAIEISEGILWLRFGLPMALDHVNVFALDDGDSWTVIDTGFDNEETRAAWRAALKGPLGGKPVSRLIVTHHHPDHIGLAGWFQSEIGAELVTTRTAWLMARMMTLDNQATPPTELLNFWRGAGVDAATLEQRAKERPFNFSDVVGQLPLGYTRVKADDVITIGGREWNVRIGHGHAPEHATFWSTDGEIVLGGDQLLPSISPNLGVYATEPDADPVREWLDSCEYISQFATPQQLVLPGHKLPFTGLPKRMFQLMDNHHGALERLAEHIEQPKTAVECFAPLFKRSISEKVFGMALVEAMAHVNHMWKADLATRVLREDGAWLWQSKH